MPDFDPRTVDLTQYPVVGAYTYPVDFDACLTSLGAALALPPGVALSANRKLGASWASWAGGAFQFPSEPIEVRLRVLRLAADKKAGEVLLVSYVAVVNGVAVAVSEDHAFKPPRPAKLVFVDASGALAPISDAHRATVASLAPAAKTKKPTKPNAEPAKPNDKPAKPNAEPTKPSATAFVVEHPIASIAVARGAAALATAHHGASRVTLFGPDGARLAEAAAGGGGMITSRRPAFAPDGARVAIGASDVRIVDARTGAELARPELPKKLEVTALAWNDDGLFVTGLTPKALVLHRFDGASLAKTASFAVDRAPGMLEPSVDGDVLHLAGEGEIVRVELATGAERARVDVAARFGPSFVLEGVGPAGLVLTTPAQPGTTFFLDRDTYATRAAVRGDVVTPAGDGFARVEGDALVWLDRDGAEAARTTLPAIAGLDAHLASLARANAKKASFDASAYRLDAGYSTWPPSLVGLPDGTVIVARAWSIAVYGPDRTLRAVTTL